MYDHILVPLDGSKRSETILPHIEELAGRLKAKVLLLHIPEQPLMLGYDEAEEILDQQQQQEQRRQQVENYLENIQKKFHEKNIRSHFCIAYGPVVRTILTIAEKHGADLIALSSGGLDGSFRTLSAGVTARLLQKFDLPVLIVREKSTDMVNQQVS